MKHLALIGFVLLTFSASAQKVNFNSSNAKHDAGIHTQFNFTLTEISGAQQVQELTGKMRTTPGLLKLDILNPTANGADLIIITTRKDDVAIVEKAFAAAGISKVTYDDKKVKSTNLTKAFNSKK